VRRWDAVHEDAGCSQFYRKQGTRLTQAADQTRALSYGVRFRGTGCARDAGWWLGQALRVQERQATSKLFFDRELEAKRQPVLDNCEHCSPACICGP